MNNFKVIKNPDGTMTTVPADPPIDNRDAHRELRDMLDGGGWFDDPNAKKDEPEPLPKWDGALCGCFLRPPCHYCESGEYEAP